MKQKKELSSELLFIIAMITNSFALVLMIKSGLGISTLSSVPLVVSNIMPILSLGSWTVIIQISYILVLVLFTHKFKYGYLVSFLVAIPFGLLVDGFSAIITPWPNILSLRLIYFTVGMFAMGFGASLFVICKLPILPFDMIVREIADYKKISVKHSKMFIDVMSVIVSVSLSLFFMHHIEGVGVGTVVSVILMGPTIQYFINFISSCYDIQPQSQIGRNLTSIS